MDERKADMEITGWDGVTRENTPDAASLVSVPPVPSSRSVVSTRTLSLNDDSEIDSDCPKALEGQKGTKVNVSEITQLKHDSNVAQFNNWLQDLKAAFFGDPSRFPTNRHKVNFASLTLDEELKTTYNITMMAHPAVSTHWRKFKRWIKRKVLHGDQDRRKLMFDFAAARQRFNETPSQFHLRLFNLGLLSGHTVIADDYLPRLIKPLRLLLDQYQRTYEDLDDAADHARQLWRTLDLEELRQQYNEKKERDRNRAFKGRGGQQGQQGGRSPEKQSADRPQNDNRVTGPLS